MSEYPHVVRNWREGNFRVGEKSGVRWEKEVLPSVADGTLGGEEGCCLQAEGSATGFSGNILAPHI